MWTHDGMIVRHELASEALRFEMVAELAVSGQQRSGSDTGRSAAGPASPSASTAPPDGGARLPVRTLPRKSSPDSDDCVSDLCRRVGKHLRGVATSYAGISIDLEWATPLQRDLAAVARAIPWGEVVSYGELAALAGRPGAARAAGSFCAENRFSLIIPCHRVVAANGIGGYGIAGPALKRRLLALEGVHL